jgi:hypothetical protein
MSKPSHRPGREELKERARKKNTSNASGADNSVKPGGDRPQPPLPPTANPDSRALKRRAQPALRR